MERNHFFVCHAGEVVYYIMCFASDGFTCIGGGKSDHCCPGSHSGLQAVERIFKDVGVFGGGFKDFRAGSSREPVWNGQTSLRSGCGLPFL